MYEQIPWYRTLQFKLLLCLGALVAILAGLFIAGHHLGSVLREATTRVTLVTRGRRIAHQVLYLSERSFDESGKRSPEALEKLTTVMEDQKKRYQVLLDGDASQGVKALEGESRNRILGRKEEWNNKIVPAVRRVFDATSRSEARLSELGSLIEAFIAQVDENVKHEERIADEAARQGAWLLWGLAGSALVVLVAVSLVLRNAVQRLAVLSKASRAIAKGDSNVDVSVQGNDEIASLARQVSLMSETLRGALEKTASEKARTQAILDSTADAIVTLNEAGDILWANAAAKRLFGFRIEEMVGKKASIIVPVLYQPDARYERSSLRQGEARAMGDEAEVEGKRNGGGSVPLAMRVTEMLDGKEHLFVATLQNIAARKKAEQERTKIFEAIRGAVNRLAAATQEILATTTEQASGAQEQAAAVTQTVATVQQISQTASQAAERAETVAESSRRSEEVGKVGRRAVSASVTAMDQVREQVESLAENILSLAERAQAIGEITATVNDIAEQTNVLALNAAVEASRAGEHGKGFAVVAGEVKSLAQQSKKATAQVRQILSEIQQATNRAVLSTEQGTKAVGSANEVVGEAGQTIDRLAEALAQSARTAAQISASANQQAAGLSQLNEGIRNIDRVTKQNVEAIQQIEQAAQNLNTLSNELASLTA